MAASRRPATTWQLCPGWWSLNKSSALRLGHWRAAYESLLAWKGQVLRAARTGRAALREELGSEGRALADRLHNVSAALSNRVTDIARGVSALGPRELSYLVQERQRLERELAPLTARLLPAVPTWAELRDAVPKHTALVDLFLHRFYEPARWDGPTHVEKGRWTEPHVTAWVTRADSAEPVPIDLGSVAAIGSAIREHLRVQVGDEQEQRDEQEGKESRGTLALRRIEPGPDLRRLVWDPLVPHLVGIGTVIVSPDGVMGTFPYEILREEDGRFLVEDRAFIYLTDPTDLVRMPPERATTGNRLLLVGGVDYGIGAEIERKVEAQEAAQKLAVAAMAAPARESLRRGGWQRLWKSLTHTEEEAAAVRGHHETAFSGATCESLFGPRAVEEQLKLLLPQCSTAHLATHGYFNPEGLPSLEEASRREAERRRDRPLGLEESFVDVARRLEGYSPGLLSGLVCAGVNSDLPEGRDDGYLTAEEVTWLDLSGVDLVVLSACDTGLGRPRSGEGLIGLRRAFLLAGAKTVISSLWSIPDQETSELMELFYGNLWQKGMGKHEALRQAQLEMIRRNRARSDGDARPETWGAFVLDGDWR